MTLTDETAIRAVVQTAVTTYASAFETRHLADVDNPGGTINMKIHNVFVAVLGPEVQYYSALSRSLDSSLGSMLEKMAIGIARLSYDVARHVEGALAAEQTTLIASILERYKRREVRPEVEHYEHNIRSLSPRPEDSVTVRHESDYYLTDPETNTAYLIELKIGGDLDNKKARSEKEALLEQYAILTNQLGAEADVKLRFATAYNRFGEGMPWAQERVRQFFAEDELLIGSEFWNFVSRRDDGYEIVLDEFKANAQVIRDALETIKQAYVG